MAARGAESPHPAVFLLLNLPAGIGNGFLTVAVPFVVTRAGLSVGTAASIVAIGLLPQALKILWSPAADITLTLKRWYAIGIATCCGAMVALSAIPVSPRAVPAIAATAFVLIGGVTLLQLPLGAMMALAVPERLKGRAAGWYQVGHLGGAGLGGGAGVWLATHAGSPLVAGLALAALCLSCATGLLFVPEPHRTRPRRVAERLLNIGRELWGLVRSSNGILAMALVFSPIGAGAAANLWSAVAPEWHASPNMVALVTGAASAIVSSVGCLVGGWWADRSDRRIVFLMAGGLLAIVGLLLAAAPRVPAAFAVGTLAYALALGMATAAFSALVLDVIGQGAAASKYTLLAALGNAPISYMTAVDGWTHDRWNTSVMLAVESLVCLALIGLVALVLPMLSRRRAVPAAGALAG